MSAPVINGHSGPVAGIEQAQSRENRPDEMAVLGAMLSAGPTSTVPAEVRELLRPGDEQKELQDKSGIGEHHFSSPAHRLVWRTIIALMDAGEPHDLNAVWAALPLEQLALLQNGAYLATLAEACPTPANGTWYARNLANTTLLRSIADAGAAQALAAGASALNDATEVLERAQARLNALVPPGRRGAMEAWPTLGPVALDEMERLDALAKSDDPEAESVFSTPWPDLNRLLGPVAPGAMIIIAGRPGMAKSTAMRDIAQHLGMRRKRLAPIFSLEMSKMEISLCLMAAGAKIRTDDIKHGTMSDDDWSRAARYLGVTADAKLSIDDTPGMNMAYVDRVLGDLARQHDEDPAAYFFDYLQLGHERGHGNRQEEVSAMSRGHKLMAKKRNTVAVVLSQLNRGPEGRSDKRPQLSDLRESGSLEQDADIVILLHRDDYYDPECPNAGEIDLVVAKNRGGPTGVVTLAAQLHMSRLVSMAMN
jgi:replicative DNA helicase